VAPSFHCKPRSLFSFALLGTRTTHTLSTMVTKLLNVFTVTSIALIACLFTSHPANALSIYSGGHLIGRHMSPVHETFALKKRAHPRCKKGKPSTTTISAASGKSTAKAKASTSKGPTYSGSDNGGKGGLAWPNGNAFSLGPWKTDRVSQ
jgi:hypothetical protein